MSYSDVSAADRVPPTNATKKRSVIADKRGATAIEYGLIAALIAVAAVGAMSGLGSQISKTFNNASGEMAKG